MGFFLWGGSYKHPPWQGGFRHMKFQKILQNQEESNLGTYRYNIYIQYLVMMLKESLPIIHCTTLSTWCEVWPQVTRHCVQWFFGYRKRLLPTSGAWSISVMKYVSKQPGSQIRANFPRMNTTRNRSYFSFFLVLAIHRQWNKTGCGCRH